MLAMTLATEQHTAYFEKIQDYLDEKKPHKANRMVLDKVQEDNATVFTLNREEEVDVRLRFQKPFRKHHKTYKVPHDENFFNEIQRLSREETWQGG